MKRDIESTRSQFDDFMVARVYIVDDAVTATLENLYISSSSDDDLYLEYDEDELLSLSYSEIHRINKVEVLDRIHDLYLEGRFDKQPLTDPQRKKLKDWYKLCNPKEIISNVAPILNAIMLAVSANKLYDRTCPDEQWKNYARSKGIDLDMDDYLMLLKNLTEDQCIREIKNKDTLRLGNRLLEFKLTCSFVTHNGTKLSNVLIYIKIEKQIVGGNIVLISFHDPES